MAFDTRLRSGLADQDLAILEDVLARLHENVKRGEIHHDGDR